MTQEIMTLEAFTAAIRGYVGKEIDGKALTDEEIFVLYHRKKLPSWVKDVEKRGMRVSLELKTELINKVIKC